MNQLKSTLEWISLIGTPISFVATFLTLILSMKIKKKVARALDTNQLRTNYPSISQDIESYRGQILNESETLILSEIRIFLIEIKEEYPFVKSDLLSLLDETIQLTTRPKNHKQSEEEKNTLIENLTKIKTKLGKEIRI